MPSADEPRAGSAASRPFRLEAERTRQDGHKHYVERKRARSFASEEAAVTAARTDLEAGWYPTVFYGRVIVFDWIEEL